MKEWIWNTTLAKMALGWAFTSSRAFSHHHRQGGKTVSSRKKNYLTVHISIKPSKTDQGIWRFEKSVISHKSLYLCFFFFFLKDLGNNFMFPSINKACDMAGLSQCKFFFFTFLNSDRNWQNYVLNFIKIVNCFWELQ